jgi:AcrR family transcriptional regulator
VAIETARRLFIEDGYAAFSMRKVARAIGISQGHLQHFFPTREDLVNAMLDQTAAHYIGIYEAALSRTEGDAVARFEDVVNYLIEDITNSEMTHFFLELWPLTAHSEKARAMLPQIYRRNYAGFANVVLDIRPELSQQAAQDIALQILALIDGLILFCHSARPDADALARAQQGAKKTIRMIAGLTDLKAES